MTTPCFVIGAAFRGLLHPDEVCREGLYDGPEVPQEDHEGPLCGGVPVLRRGDEHCVNGGHVEQEWLVPTAM